MRMAPTQCRAGLPDLSVQGAWTVSCSTGGSKEAKGAFAPSEV